MPTSLFGEDESMSSLVASPASLPRSPGRAKGLPTTDGSGLTQCGLFESVAPGGLSSRTFLALLASSLTALTGCSVSWKERAISAFRSLWAPTTWGHRTDESECGSSGDWGTPNAHERTHTPRRVDHGQQLANQVAEWKTHCPPNGGQSYLPGTVSETGMTMDGQKRQLGLEYQVKVSAWPTPTGVTETGGMAACKWGGARSREMLRKSEPKMMNAQLNPAWVESLMGYPDGWTDIPFVGPRARGKHSMNGKAPAPAPALQTAPDD